MDISAEVRQHDKYQIELKFICPFDERKKLNDCHIDLFFFLPRSLSVNAKNYPNESFYKDFTEYVRFKTPSMSLDMLTDPGNPALRRLSDAIRRLPGSEEDFSIHLKMFCSIAKSALRDTESALENSDAASREEKVDDYIFRTSTLLKNFRALCPSQKDFPKAEELFSLVDEFLSITSNGYLFRFWEFLQNHPSECKESIVQKIAGFTGQEIRYRREHGFTSAETDNSELLYRESVLKKAMGGILYLNVSMRKDGVFLENLLLGLCAAVAMIFVTGISFLWKGLFLEEFSVSFFIVWVIAYMFKDRIKSQLQLFCMDRRSRYSYDYLQKIRDGLGKNVGVCREGFRYIDAADLSEEVVRVRNRTSLSRLENGSLDENVMLYRKKLELFGNAGQGVIREFNVHGIANIYRMNIRHWTVKMDNPSRIIYTSDGKQISPIEAKRDYHINLVIRYGEEDGPEHYARYRLVLCRNGIRRIDRFAEQKITEQKETSHGR